MATRSEKTIRNGSATALLNKLEGDMIESKCERCGKLFERYEQIFYSVGERVCKDCKKRSQQSDNNAYDNWVTDPER